MSAGRALAAALVSAALVLPAAQAWAHARSSSTSSWQLESGPASSSARVTARASWRDLQGVLPQLAGATPAILDTRADIVAAVDAYFTERFRLYAAGAPCEVAGPVVAAPSPDPMQLSRAWRVRCAGPGPSAIRIDAFFEAFPGHFHLARVSRADGSVIERVFVLGDSTLALAPETAGAPARGSGVLDYLLLGIEHIATGADHLAFLLALLLLGVSVFEVATIVTGFTVAHSITLALGVLGVIEPAAAAIEALIGLSIAVVALENFALTVGPATRRGIEGCLAAGVALAALGAAAGLLRVPAVALAGIGIFAFAYLRLLHHVERPARMRWFVALVFGLIHGFGFAGLLGSIGLPPGRVAPALFGFNLGVEIGQLAIVAAVWPLLRLALRGGEPRRTLWVQAGSTPILAAGVFWFLTRAIG
ncbi:MAG: HupE/UreJ family protein [Myxococcota bacterium]